MGKQKPSMAASLTNFVRRGQTLFSDKVLHQKHDKDDFSKVSQVDVLFPKVDPAVDGEDCDHDCASCTIKYPAKFKVEESIDLYGGVKPWATHLLVATGKSDWVRDVEDEKRSVMEAVGRAEKPRNGVSWFSYLSPYSSLRESNMQYFLSLRVRFAESMASHI